MVDVKLLGLKDGLFFCFMHSGSHVFANDKKIVLQEQI